MDGSIDNQKFTDFVLQANIIMTRALANRPVDEHQQFLLENPPCLMNGAFMQITFVGLILVIQL